MPDSFAQKQMQRYGWSEGKGLGRNESGMKSAIKVKLKNNTMGLGHDQGAEFTFHWWDHIFNKAASSFKVNENEDGVVMEKCEGKKLTPLLISNKRGLATRLGNKSLLYGTFVKAGTYDGNKPPTEADEVINEFSSDSDDSDDEDGKGGKDEGMINDTLQKMFLETGLTGHKAARHGHSLNGKLQRLMQQEERELPKSTEVKKKEKSTTDICDVSESNPKDTKKKKKKKKMNSDMNDTEHDNPTPADDKVDVVKERKKKKKKKLSDNVSAGGSVDSNVEGSELNNKDSTTKSKKEKRKHKLDDHILPPAEQPKKKKKKKENKSM